MRPIPTDPMLENCAVCAKETRHEPDRDGVYHCVACRERKAAEAKEQAAAKARPTISDLRKRNRAALQVAIVVGLAIVALVVVKLGKGCVGEDGPVRSTSFSRCLDRMRKLADDTLTAYDMGASERYCRTNADDF